MVTAASLQELPIPLDEEPTPHSPEAHSFKVNAQQPERIVPEAQGQWTPAEQEIEVPALRADPDAVGRAMARDQDYGSDSVREPTVALRSTNLVITAASFEGPLITLDDDVNSNLAPMPAPRIADWSRKQAIAPRPVVTTPPRLDVQVEPDGPGRRR